MKRVQLINGIEGGSVLHLVLALSWWFQKMFKIILTTVFGLAWLLMLFFRDIAAMDLHEPFFSPPDHSRAH
jgi:hypothetical protein